MGAIGFEYYRYSQHIAPQDTIFYCNLGATWTWLIKIIIQHVDFPA
jgi:hypothetical protein